MKKNWNGNYDASFGDLLGKTIVEIDGLEIGSETVRFTTKDGEVYQMHYYPD